MKFFLDENFPKTAYDMLVSRGHEVFDIRGTEHEGADDDDIFTLAQNRSAVFLRTDRYFFHTIPHLYDQHYGVVVIALRQPNRQKILAKLEWFLEHYQNISLENRVFQLRDQTYIVLPHSDSES